MKNRLSFAEWTFIAYGSTLSLYLLLFLGSANFALRPEWDDQISNLYSTWIFWDHGTSLMTEPTGSFLTPLAPEEKLKFVQDTGLREENMGAYKAQPAYINWQNIPRNYPAGFHIMISPFAYVLKKNWLSLRTTLALETLCFLFICHITFVFIWRSVKPTGANRMEWGIFLLAFALLYFEALRWSLNSQYEMVPVFFMTLACIAYRTNCDLWCFVSAFAALFLHLRALFYLPLPLFVLYRNCESLNVKSILAQISQLRWIHWLIGLFALISTTLALITIYGTGPILKMKALYDLNDLHVANLLANWPKTALYLTTAAGACWHWWRRGYVAAIATLFVTSALISQSRLVREWYCLPLIPLFVLAIGENNSRSYLKDLVVVLIMFTAISSLAFHNSIFELRLFKEIFEAIRRVS